MMEHPNKHSASKLSKWTTEWITDWWGIELACWIISALSLVAIVITLQTFKDKPVPQWSYGITLNSLISIFAQIGLMAIMKPTVECISQLKWLWFLQREKLETFQTFDDASRGPTGSLLLLWKLHGMHLVSLGATITLASAAFGPFAQQVVSYPLRGHLVGNATAQQVFMYTGAADNNAGFVSPAVTASVYDGLTAGDLNLSAVAPFCSTGNCTWNTYPSLGVCANVLDVSSTLEKSTCNLTAWDELFEYANTTNPGLPCFNYTLPEQAVSDSADNPSSISFSPIDLSLSSLDVMLLETSIGNTSLINSYLIYQPDYLASINSSLADPIAYALTLDICVQTYSTTVTNGIVNTTPLSSEIIDLISPQSFSAPFNSSTMKIDGGLFGIGFIAAGDVARTLQNILGSQCGLVVGGADFAGGDIIETSECESSSGTALFEIFLNSTDPFSDISRRWEKLATSMTNSFRTGAGGNIKVNQFGGKAFTSTAHVEANYLWLILPISLVSFTGVFLLATILKSHRLGSRVWKSSNFATLQGLNSELHTQLGGISSISEMEEKAKEVEVRFDMELKGGNGRHTAEFRLVESKKKVY